jgi:tetratricopeptide (TPR) repeat protein
MPTLLKVICVASVVLLTCAVGRGQSLSSLMAKGDTFDKTFQAEEALKYYLPAEKLEPTNVPILVRVARQYRHMMIDAPLNEEKLRLGGLSLDYARRAAALAPNSSEAQLEPAIIYGKMLPFEGTREQIESTPLIKAAADRAIQLDPRNDVAWYVLGRWHEVLADVGMLKRVVGQLLYGKLPTSTNEEAVTCFQTAMEINPRLLRNYVELGRTYAQMGRIGDARKFISKGLAMPNSQKDDPEVKIRGRETLAKLP